MLGSTSLDVATLAERLIEAPSVTPAAGLVFDALEAMLEPLGFAVTRFHAGEPPDGHGLGSGGGHERKSVTLRPRTESML